MSGLTVFRGLSSGICLLSARSTGFARCWSSSTVTAQEAATSTSAITAPKIFAACVLERLPIVMPSSWSWKEEHVLWRRSEDLRLGYSKDQQAQAREEGQAKTSSSPQAQQDLRKFNPVASTTADDARKNTRSMKRHLDERLYLLVKRPPLTSEPGTTVGSANPPSSWHFPVVQHLEGESIRECGERALSSTIGRAHPIYFIGNAPMGHLPSVPAGSNTFFMLAQAVGDPWECVLKPESGCEDWAWVTKQELRDFIQDPRVRELTSRML